MFSVWVSISLENTVLIIKFLWCCVWALWKKNNGPPGLGSDPIITDTYFMCEHLLGEICDTIGIVFKQKHIYDK